MSEARLRKRITIQDVAMAAGASPGVVSSVLNGNRHKTTRVSPETQERIRQAAATLGYRPNALARSLQRRQTRNILFASYYVSSLLHAGGGGGFFIEVLDGALNAATRSGYDLMVHLVHADDPEKVAVLGDGRADGCLWIGPNAADPVLSRLETGLGWPLVAFGSRIRGATASVIADNFQAMDLAVGHLYERGHRRLAFVNQSTQRFECVERWEAFRAACVQREIDPRQIMAEQTPPDENGRSSIVEETLVEPFIDAATRPTGVVAFNDGLAAAVLRLAPRVGLQVPHDLSVIGMDSTDFCLSQSPPLTSLRQPLRTMAQRCVELLIAQIDQELGQGGEGDGASESGLTDRGETIDIEGVRTVVFPCELDIRASTGIAPGG